MALSRALSNFNKYVSSTATTTATARATFRRNNCSSAEPDRALKPGEYHGLLAKGHELPYLFYLTGKGFVFRFDVPGIRQANLSCTTTGSKFSFTAQETKPHRFGFGHCEPRYYEGEIDSDPLVYQPERFTAKLDNGVLLVEIPKIMVGPGSPKMGWICLKIGRVKARVDADGKITMSTNPDY